MAQSIAPSSAGIKRHFCQLLTRDAVLDACRTAGHRWRERKFDPVVTIHLFVLQVLHGNAAILTEDRGKGVRGKGVRSN